MNLLKKKLLKRTLLFGFISTMFMNASLTEASAQQNITPSSSAVYVDGAKVNYDVKPIVKDGTVLVPIRETLEAMGATVGWDQAENSIYVTKGRTKVKLTLDSDQSYINGQPKKLLTPPINYKNKIMIPLRFVGEAFGGSIDYNTHTNDINITMSNLLSEFLTKEQAVISNIQTVENVEMFGNRRLMISDNPETLNYRTIQGEHGTLWNDIVEEDSMSEDHRLIGWHLNQFDQEVTVGITIENVSPTNTIQIKDIREIVKISRNSWYDYNIGIPISEAVLNNQLFDKYLWNSQLGYGESVQLENIKLKPNEMIGFLNDFTVKKVSGTGKLNYIVRTVFSKDDSDLKQIKSEPVPLDQMNSHPRGVWRSSELMVTLPTYHVTQDDEVSYNLSNGQTDNLLNAENSLVENALSNRGHYGVIYKVKIPYVNDSKENKTIRVRIGSRGGTYSGTVKTKEGVFNIPNLQPMKDVANVIDYRPTDNEGFIELDIMHAGGSYLPIAVNIITLEE